MYQLVMIRHGESQWNQENRFTGWQDVDLSEKGRAEAARGGKALKEEGFVFDRAYTSVLKRAIRTLWIVMDEAEQMWLPVQRSWRLNERHYGALTGLNKAETAAKHGEEQVKIWRRSYDTPPPLMDAADERHPRFDLRYRNIDARVLLAGESLKDTVARVLPIWADSIVPAMVAGEKVLIVAHGNSLRAMIQHIEGMSADEIMQVNLPTGIPLMYTLDKDFKMISKEFIGDAEEVKKAIETVANQGKAK